MLDILSFTALVVFYILFLGRTIILMKQGVKVWVISSGKGGLAKLFEALLVPALVLWTFEVIMVSLNTGFHVLPDMLFQPLYQTTWLRWMGFGLCVAGLLIFFVALISFGNAWRIGIDEQSSNRLVTSGAFSMSRNPIFLFMDLFYLGTALIYPSWLFILFFVIMGAGIHLQILREEAFLLRKFGKAYADYKKRTPRYIGFI